MRLLPAWHLMGCLTSLIPDGQEQLPFTQLPPFKQGKSLEQSIQQNKCCLPHNKSSKTGIVIYLSPFPEEKVNTHLWSMRNFPAWKWWGKSLYVWTMKIRHTLYYEYNHIQYHLNKLLLPLGALYGIESHRLRNIFPQNMHIDLYLNWSILFGAVCYCIINFGIFSIYITLLRKIYQDILFPRNPLFLGTLQNRLSLHQMVKVNCIFDFAFLSPFRR